MSPIQSVFPVPDMCLHTWLDWAYMSFSLVMSAGDVRIYPCQLYLLCKSVEMH